MQYYTKFDKEYATQNLKETAFLRDKGIKQAFVKEVNGLTTFKYKKTNELFVALSVFYCVVD